MRNKSGPNANPCGNPVIMFSKKNKHHLKLPFAFSFLSSFPRACSIFFQQFFLSHLSRGKHNDIMKIYLKKKLKWTLLKTSFENEATKINSFEFVSTED